MAGFGNLPGDMTFYDKKADAKCKVMGTTRASNGVSLEWSPCGRYVLTATTAPRLRVDNGFQVFKYNGDLLAQKRYDVLYEAMWRPVEEGTFEDRPQTPRAQGAKEPSGPAAPPAAGQVRGLRAPPPSATGHHERSESIVQSCKRPGGYRGQDKADACGGQGGQGLVCSRRGAWRRAGVRCLQGGVKERETTCKEEANGRDFVSTDDGRVKETCLRYGTEQTRGLLLFNDRGVGRHISVRTIFPRESGQDSPLVPSFGHSLFHSSSTYFRSHITTHIVHLESQR